MQTCRKNARNSEKVQLRKWWGHFLKHFGKLQKFWSFCLEFQVSSLGLRIFDEISVSKVMVSTTSLPFSVANAKTKTQWSWFLKYFILRIRFNKISLFRMVLKRLKLHQMTWIFRWCGTKFTLHTSIQNFTIWQHCSTTPTPKTIPSMVTGLCTVYSAKHLPNSDEQRIVSRYLKKYQRQNWQIAKKTNVKETKGFQTFPAFAQYLCQLFRQIDSLKFSFLSFLVAVEVFPNAIQWKNSTLFT